jgi:hypothetical protein
MDGVLVDFVTGTFRLFDIDPAYGHGQMQAGDWNYFRRFGITDAEFYGKIDDRGVQFWTDLEPYPHAKELYELCCSLAPTYILTQPILPHAIQPKKHQECVAGKILWLQNWLKDARFYNYVITAHKQLLAKPNHVLVDDNDGNVKKFYEAGSASITFPQIWNQSHRLRDIAMECTRASLLAWSHEPEKP